MHFLQAAINRGQLSICTYRRSYTPDLSYCLWHPVKFNLPVIDKTVKLDDNYKTQSVEVLQKISLETLFIIMYNTIAKAFGTTIKSSDWHRSQECSASKINLL